jgi:Protein of unknown function (DUF3485)
MSQMLIESPSVVPVPEIASTGAAAPNQRGVKAEMSPWKWAAITCLILSISGGIRFGRDLQFRGYAEQSKKCPFPLSDLPKVLGTWTAVPNSDAHLDPEIARIAGSSDYVIRDYVDSTTGEVATILVLYGLADSVFGHTPDICYVAAGYQPVSQPTDREFSLPDSPTPIRFRGFYVAKSGVGMTDYSEVVWAFWHAGAWFPEVGSRWKLFRSSPAVFKIQIQRPASGLSLERFSCESLLQETVREINTRIEQSRSRDAIGSAQEKTAL